MTQKENSDIKSSSVTVRLHLYSTSDTFELFRFTITQNSSIGSNRIRADNYASVHLPDKEMQALATAPPGRSHNCLQSSI